MNIKSMMQFNKLKFQIRQKEESLKNLNNILDSSDTNKVEKELIQKNAQLLEQLDRYKKQIIRMKFDGQKIDKKKKMTQRVTKNQVTQFQIELEIKKNNIQKEIECTDERMSNLRVTGTNFRITEFMDRNERKTTIHNFMKENKSSAPKEDQLLDFFEAEMEVTRNANNIQLMKLIQDMEQTISMTENEKNLQAIELESKIEDLKRMTENNKKNIQEKKTLTQQVEELFMQVDDLKFNYNQKIQKNKDLKEKILILEKSQSKLNTNQEKSHYKIQSELKKKIDNLETERNILSQRIKKALDEKITTKDIQSIQNERISSLEKQVQNYEQNQEKFEKSQKEMKNEIKQKNKDLNEMNDKYMQLLEGSKTELQLLEMKNNNKILQLEEQIKKLKESNTNLIAQDDQQQLEDNILGRLSELQDFDYRPTHMLMPRMTQRQSRLSYLQSDTIEEMECDLDNEILDQENEEFKLLDEIKQKDEEIIKLRKELCDLRESQVDKKLLKQLQQELEKLKLDLKHSKEQQEHVQKQCDKKVKGVEQQNDMFLENLQKTKMEYFDYISSSDYKMTKFINQIKVQEKMLEAYDQEIKNFNVKMKKKKQLILSIIFGQRNLIL